MKAPVALSAAHRRTLYAVLLMVAVSGIAWLVVRYFLREGGDLADLPHPLESWMLKWHGAAAMAALVAAGSVLPWHAWRAWQTGRNVATGGAMAVVLGFLAATGWAIYYLPGERAHEVAGLLHWLVGLALLPVAALHVVRGRRLRAANPKPPAAAPGTPPPPWAGEERGP